MLENAAHETSRETQCYYRKIIGEIRREVRRKREVKEVANSSATDGESAETRTANAD